MLLFFFKLSLFFWWILACMLARNKKSSAAIFFSIHQTSFTLLIPLRKKTDSKNVTCNFFCSWFFWLIIRLLISWTQFCFFLTANARTQKIEILFRHCVVIAYCRRLESIWNWQYFFCLVVRRKIVLLLLLVSLCV